MNKKFLNKVQRPIEAFFQIESASGIILASAAVLAMILANSGASQTYFDFLQIEIGSFSIHHWINDGLMVIFFFLIGMELKREIVVGELSRWKEAALPIAAAVGGMMFPALFYFLLNPEGEGRSGWGIPMATDIAFALGVLTLFGKRVPVALKVFLLALAIVDDLGAILVIAFFYTQKIQVAGFVLAALAFAGVIGLQRLHVRSYRAYVLVGVVAWIGVLYSGVHATLAGVILGLMTPLEFPVNKGHPVFYSPLERLVHSLHPWVSFCIMPVFALANAGIDLRGLKMDAVILHPVHQGVVLGLFVGKPLGIFILSRLFVWMNWGQLPKGLSWLHILAVGFLGGIGFTMALFVSSLALPSELESFSKSGIILGSVLSSFAGVLLMLWVTSRKSD